MLLLCNAVLMQHENGFYPRTLAALAKVPLSYEEFPQCEPQMHLARFYHGAPNIVLQVYTCIEPRL